MKVAWALGAGGHAGGREDDPGPLGHQARRRRRVQVVSSLDDGQDLGGHLARSLGPSLASTTAWPRSERRPLVIVTEEVALVQVDVRHDH